MILFTGGEDDLPDAAVPELTGLTYARARERLADLGLFLRSDSTILAQSDTVRVTFQSLPAGETVPAGTVLEVTLVNNDDETYGLY